MDVTGYHWWTSEPIEARRIPIGQMTLWVAPGLEVTPRQALDGQPVWFRAFDGGFFFASGAPGSFGFDLVSAGDRGELIIKVAG